MLQRQVDLRSVRVLAIACAIAVACCERLPAQLQVLTQTTFRGTARAVCFDPATRTKSATLKLSFGSPVWKAAYDEPINVRGKRLRFGSGEWATFESDAALKIAGVAVAQGRYRLAADCSDDGQWALVFVDPAELMERKIPPYRSEETVGLGSLVRLRHSRVAASASRLEVVFEPVAPSENRIRIVIRWGQNRFEADVQLENGDSRELRESGPAPSSEAEREVDRVRELRCPAVVDDECSSRELSSDQRKMFRDREVGLAADRDLHPVRQSDSERVRVRLNRRELRMDNAAAEFWPSWECQLCHRGRFVPPRGKYASS